MRDPIVQYSIHEARKGADVLDGKRVHDRVALIIRYKKKNPRGAEK
jgi:hypothetical protein